MTGAVLVLGIGVRLALDPGGVGDRSAAVMMVLLGVGAWTATALLATSRPAFLVTLGLVALLELAALPPRAAPEYDDRQAFYRTDQVLAVEVPGTAAPSPALTLLAEPIFAGAQPRFGLGGDVGGTTVAWECPFQHGIQRLALPLPAATVSQSASTEVRLHLTGSASRDSDYLLVYASASRGGFLVSLVGAADVSQGGVTCTLR